MASCISLARLHELPAQAPRGTAPTPATTWPCPWPSGHRGWTRACRRRSTSRGQATGPPSRSASPGPPASPAASPCPRAAAWRCTAAKEGKPRAVATEHHQQRPDLDCSAYRLRNRSKAQLMSIRKGTKVRRCKSKPELRSSPTWQPRSAAATCHRPQ